MNDESVYESEILESIHETLYGLHLIATAGVRRSMSRLRTKSSLALLTLVGLASLAHADTVTGWQLQDAAKVDATGEQISAHGYQPAHWFKATVPGTVLTSLLNDGVYPEPLYGENNRKIPEALAHSSYWYRAVTTFKDNGQHDWIRFNGINYQAEVFVNGHDLGPIKGAFVRGEFDVTPYVRNGKAAIAVHVYPPPHPGVFHEHTVATGTGRNGGAMGQDGATFVATVGWDWIPGIRDRDTGLWQSVEAFQTGPIRLKDPYITTDFDVNNPLEATVGGEVTIQNLEDQPRKEQIDLSMGVDEEHGISVELAPHQTVTVHLPTFTVKHPRLWWPNGYGEPNLYRLDILACIDVNNQPIQKDDSLSIPFGIKKYGYFVPGSKNLTITVNGVKVFCKGGNWGMDEAMKRIPSKRLDAEIRMHRDANCNMIRNWVGQSTEEDFYALCDKYGIMVWDDFWLANPADGPIPNDNALFMKNAREKVLRFRNHPSIAVWCGRNEADPPPVLNAGLKALIDELDPNRFYQPNSAKRPQTHGVGGGGPYSTRPVPFYFNATDGIHTEVGMPSIPTLESIEAMMPAKDLHPDWSKLNDDFAEHDLTRGAQDGQQFPSKLAARYGPISDLADFVRKSQMANYEGYRAMFEGRNSKLFNPATGTLLWMSAPAQPSFVWQLFAYDLEPDAALFGTEKACEPIHVQYNPVTDSVEVVNNTAKPLDGYSGSAALYGVNGAPFTRLRFAVGHRLLGTPIPANSVETVLAHLNKSPIIFPQAGPGYVDYVAAEVAGKPHFLKLELRDASGRVIADNFYWEPATDAQTDMTELQNLPTVGLDLSAQRVTVDAGSVRYTIELKNPTRQVALLAHVQLRRKRSGKRVLPVFYSDNYVSLLPGESKTITVEAAKEDLGGEPPLVTLDGWNVRVGRVSGSIGVEENRAMRPGSSEN